MRTIAKIPENVRHNDIQLSMGTNFISFCESSDVEKMDATSAVTSPTNRPSSSIRPRAKPLTPIIIMKKTANPSTNHDIYFSNSFKMLLAIFPSTIPCHCCITRGITMPMSLMPLAPVSEIIFSTKCRVLSASIIFGR